MDAVANNNRGLQQGPNIRQGQALYKMDRFIEQTEYQFELWKWVFDLVAKITLRYAQG